MIFFAPCKVNIGLEITAKRADGYHDIETLMVPVESLCDIVEVVKTAGEGVEFSNSGIEVDCAPGKNLCVKAWELMRERHKIGGVKIHLHKKVPFGAGLGGGSSDAAYVLKALNTVFEVGLNIEDLEVLGALIGSDVPFFMQGGPQLVTGRGEMLEPYALNLSGYHILIIKPPIHVSTAEAYAGIEPASPNIGLKTRLELPLSLWRDHIHNAFETSIFEKQPSLAQIKAQLYSMGAIYASMSGSGSALYALFDHKPESYEWGDDYFVHRGRIG